MLFVAESTWNSQYHDMSSIVEMEVMGISCEVVSIHMM